MTAVWAIEQGDCLDVLREIPDESFNCCVTSPPYYGLRDYGVEPREWEAISFSPMPGLPEVLVPDQLACLGMEADPLHFVGHIVQIFREVRRTLRSDGTLWLNFGDSYAANRPYQVPPPKEAQSTGLRRGLGVGGAEFQRG